MKTAGRMAGNPRARLNVFRTGEKVANNFLNADGMTELKMFEEAFACLRISKQFQFQVNDDDIACVRKSYCIKQLTLSNSVSKGPKIFFELRRVFPN